MRDLLKESFIDLNIVAVGKAKNLFKIKENSLIRMSERAVYIGVSKEDTYGDFALKKIYLKLEEAFDSDLTMNFYISSDYIFFFEKGVLMNIHPVFSSWRSLVQKIWKNNLLNWHASSCEQKIAFTKERIESFNIDNDIKELEDDNIYNSEPGTWFHQDC